MGFGSVFKQIARFFRGSPRLKIRKYDPHVLSIEDLNLPLCINEISPLRVSNELKYELKDYISLDYKHANIERLNEKEYHSFQIGIMLKGIKDKLVLHVDNKEDVFPDFILKYDIKYLELKLMDIIEIYQKKVDRFASENMLKEDYIWTPLDATYLLYYLSIYKEN